MEDNLAVELPSDPSSGEEGFLALCADPNNPGITSQCCKHHCEATLQDNLVFSARLSEVKAAISDARSTKRDVQFQILRSWLFGRMVFCSQIFDSPWTIQIQSILWEMHFLDSKAESIYV